MAEGSSVDANTTEESTKKLDGLNLTSEILKEDEIYDRSWDSSFLEDSIDERAAKALRLSSVKELLTKDLSLQERISRSKLLNKIQVYLFQFVLLC